MNAALPPRATQPGNAAVHRPHPLQVDIIMASSNMHPRRCLIPLATRHGLTRDDLVPDPSRRGSLADPRGAAGRVMAPGRRSAAPAGPC